MRANKWLRDDCSHRLHAGYLSKVSQVGSSSLQLQPQWGRLSGAATRSLASAETHVRSGRHWQQVAGARRHHHLMPNAGGTGPQPVSRASHQSRERVEIAAAPPRSLQPTIRARNNPRLPAAFPPIPARFN